MTELGPEFLIEMLVFGAERRREKLCSVESKLNLSRIEKNQKNR